MGMTITNGWKLFRYGVKRDHYEKIIGNREFSEQLSQDCFNNRFSTDSGTQGKNIPPLMILMMEIQFLIAVYFISPIVFLPLPRPELFTK